MIPARARKVIGDLCIRWGRTGLTLFGLSLGLSAASMSLVALVYLANGLSGEYRRSNPPNIVVEASSVSPEALKRIAALPDVDLAEERGQVMGRIEAAPNRWLPLLVWVVEDFRRQKVAKFQPAAGAWPPPDGGMLIERDGKFFVGNPPGSTLRVRLPESAPVAATLAGYAYDAGQPPSRMEQVIYGYVTPATFKTWSQRPPRARLLITTVRPQGARATAARVRALMAGDARVIEAHDRPRHPHQFQFDAVLALVAGIGVVAFAMCAVLTVNLVDSIMVAEQRAIGVMKAIGGRSGQIARDYLIAIGLLGLTASLISLKLALAWGQGLARGVALFFNIDLAGRHSPIWLSVLVLSVGVAAPVLACGVGVLRATGKPVREALARGQASTDSRLTDGLAWLFTPLPLLARMAGRTVLRSGRRALLSGLALAIGLTFFMTALNLRASLLSTVESVRRTKPYDLTVAFRGAYPTGQLKAWAAGFPAITRAEFWSGASATLTPRGGAPGDPLTAFGLPAGAASIRPELIAGRWIGGAPNEVAVSQKLLTDQPDIKLGGHYRMTIAGQSAEVVVSGVIREFGPGVVYAPSALIDGLTGGQGRSNLMLASLASGSYYDVSKAAAEMEQSLLTTSWQIRQATPTHMLEAIVRAHLDGLAKLLLGIAGFSLFVGALGLAASISVSVVGRFREIGVLKAVGARAPAIAALFIWEAVFIGVIGWAMAVAAAPWLSRAATAGLGELIIQFPFDDRAEAWGAPAALTVAVVIAVLASLLPIRTALRATAHRSLRSE